MKSSTSLLTVSSPTSGQIAPLPSTGSGQVIQWAEIHRVEDVAVPEGFTDIDALLEAREADPIQCKRMEAARQRLSLRLKDRVSGLAALRLRRGWSQKQLAEAMKTSQPHIARIENGRDNVLLATANQLASVLQVSLDDVNAALGYAKAEP